jgi:hypothetical protein
MASPDLTRLMQSCAEKMERILPFKVFIAAVNAGTAQ